MYADHINEIKKILYEGEFTESVIKENDIALYGWRSHHLDESDKHPFIVNIFKKNRQANLIKFFLVTIEKSTLDCVYEDASKKKFYEVLFDPSNIKIVEKIISDSEVIVDFSPIVYPQLIHYLKEKKIEIANLEKIIVEKEEKVEKKDGIVSSTPVEHKDLPKAEVKAEVKAEIKVEHKDEPKADYHEPKEGEHHA